MSVLSKTTSILTLSAVTRAYVQFAQWDEEGYGLEKLIQFDRERWLDMGSPNQITSTIEPGDLLNKALA